MAVNRIHNEVASKLRIKPGDYSYFVGQVENLFSDSVLSALDEYGIPFPLAKRLEKIFSSDGDLDVALEKLRNLNTKSLNITPFEKSLLDEAKEFL